MRQAIRRSKLSWATVALALVLSLLLLAAACGDDEEETPAASPTATETAAAETPTPTGPATGEPIKIGLLNLLSGPLASVGQPQQQALELAFEQMNAQGGVLGRPLQLVTYDTTASPEKAVEGARSLTAQGVKFIVGPATSSEVLATQQLWPTLDAISCNNSAASDDIITEKWGPNTIHVPATTNSYLNATLEIMKANYPDIKQYALLYPDYAYGQLQVEQIKKQFPQAFPGFQPDPIVFAPLQTKDFSSYL